MASLSRERKNDAFALPASAICSSPSSSCSSSGSKYIEHNVSKLDTLAGVAIKYGVEVADIKRTNGLSTDLQMFAHKSLLIPLRGRHPPPSPIQSKALVDDRDVLDSFRSAKLKSDGSFITSSAMSTLQRYYGLTKHKNRSTPEGTEMTVYLACGSPNLENESLLKSSPASNTQLRSHLSDNDLEQALLLDKSGDASDDGGEKSMIDKPVRRRQKTDNDPLITPEAAIEDDDKGFVNRIRRGLAPRSLLASLIDPEPVKQNTTPTEETSLTNSLLAVRKSSSNSSLQDSENNDSILTYSKWTLKPDSVARPIFSALPKQISVWRSKAALD
ncbi:uncharacterized protein LOC141820014 [Curcuma longa]|uniref:uncharacterized protein LOC141820014 n=1 Tax=Curcuma longa TaxID=136217 RepID=UPI003D9F65EE